MPSTQLKTIYTIAHQFLISVTGSNIIWGKGAT